MHVPITMRVTEGHTKLANWNTRQPTTNNTNQQLRSNDPASHLMVAFGWQKVILTNDKYCMSRLLLFRRVGQNRSYDCVRTQRTIVASQQPPPYHCWRQQTRQLSNANKEDYGTIPDLMFEDEDDEAFSPPPWQSLLEPSARAAWRSSAQGPPPNLAQAHFEILQECQNTSRQLRRTHKLTVKSHMALEERRERERRRAVSHRVRADSLAYKNELRRDAQASAVCYGPEKTLANLKHRLLPNYAIAKRVLMEAQSLLTADPSFQPLRVIDFGAGCGSASAAAMDVFDTLEWIHGIDPSRSMRDGAERVLQAVAKEKSVSPPRITLSESLSTERTNSSFDVALCAYTAVELPHVASMLTAAAILWEKLRPNGIFVMIEPGTPDGFNSVRAVRDMLLECCPPNKSEDLSGEQCHVLAPCTHNGKCPMERHQRNFRSKNKETITPEGNELEPALLDGAFDNDGGDDDEDNDSHIELDELSETVEQVYDEGMTTNGQGTETHAFDTAFCSFVQTFPGGSHRSSGEKFSYLVVQKRVVKPQDDAVSDDDLIPDGFGNVTELLVKTYKAGKSNHRGNKARHEATDKDSHAKLLEEARDLQGTFVASTIDKLDLEMLHGDSNRQSFGRIVRAPLKKRGHVLVDYCSSDGQGNGRIVRHRVGKGWSAKVAPGLYTAARKARWGGFWPDTKDLRIGGDTGTSESSYATTQEEGPK